MLKGFTFDLDGVITDSAVYHYQAWQKLAREIGIEINPTVNESLKGVSRMDSLNVILKFGHQEEKYTDTEKSELATRKNDYYLQLIQKMTPADILPGVKDFLEAIKAAGYKMSLASASKNAPTILDKLGLETYFYGVVDPSTLSKGKPDPEIFQRAAEVLGYDDHDCVGLEDAKAGIEAINGAGQFSVGIGDQSILAAADLNVAKTSELSLPAIEAAYKAWA